MEDTKKVTSLLMDNFKPILIDNIMVNLIFSNKYTQK
jgi:CRISPR/Cas system-associated endonuclease Cas1